MKTKTIYADYPKPTGPYFDKLKDQFKKIRFDERYAYAKSCAHCTDQVDSWNRWNCTYCHNYHKILVGFGDTDRLDMCKGCHEYLKRGG